MNGYVGYVLVSTVPSEGHAVHQEIRHLTEVVDFCFLDGNNDLGEYDAIARVEVPDFDAFAQFVINQIRTIPGVMSTKSLATIVFREEAQTKQ